MTKNIFKKIKNSLNGQQGSALILVMVLLINAILIVSTIVAVSARQQQMNARTKNTAAALQLADSAMEYILQQYRSAEGDSSINTICTSGDCNFCSKYSEFDCDEDIASVTIYFITEDEPGEKKVVDADDYGYTSLSEVKYIRTVGTHGTGNETAVRVLEASM